jgi:pimeloyl-ACP methyl ester carboxylesterase
MSRKFRLLRSLVLWLFIPLVGVLGFLTSCQSKLIYFPRPYGGGHVASWDAEPGTTVIDYQTQEGKQQAYLLSTSPKPERLWLVCGGNGTLALEWSDWLRDNAPSEDAWLMIDIPGYGACTGKPHPVTIRHTLKAVVPAAMSSLDWSLPADQAKLRFFGHSLGAAVCLMGAKEYDIRRGVMLAPFTSTMEMTKAMFGVNLGFIVVHRFDNRDRLKEMAAHGDAVVYVIHGADDEAIPVGMSRELAKDVPGVVRYMEIPGGRHNTLPDDATDEIVKAMREVRK